jgi:hypothetical protein
MDAKMPSKSPSQARLMAAAAHTKGGYDGVPPKVGQEFNQADKGGKLLSNAMKAKPSAKFGLNSKVNHRPQGK